MTTVLAIAAAVAVFAALFALAYWVRQPPAEDAPRKWRNAGRKGGPAMWVGPGWAPQQSRLEASA